MKVLGYGILISIIMFGIWQCAKDMGYRETFKMLAFAVIFAALIMGSLYLIVAY